MHKLTPLRFRPVLRRYLWGGRRLNTLLGKQLGPGDDYAESWEIVDHGADQSVVTAGPVAGTTLSRLVSDYGDQLLGRHHPRSQFPLLIKFLDAHKTLSVQVHPDDHTAAKLEPPDLGKTECWVVLQSEPGSLIYAGLQPGCDREGLEQALADGDCERCLHRFSPRPGDCVFVPAGTVHALGAGLVIAEIQQASDTTFRLFDWNRVGSDGQPRPLHIRQALEVIDFESGPVHPSRPQPTDQDHVVRLVDCDQFLLDRWQFDEEQHAGGDERCHVLVVLEGSLRVEGDPNSRLLAAGDTVMLPAGLGSVSLQPVEPVVLLDAYLP